MRCFITKIKLKIIPSKVSNEEFCEFVRSQGIEVGKGTIFYQPETVEIDKQRPWMVTIGEYCKITRGVIILQHDYSRSVLRRVYGDIVAESKRTIIRNNVFIGMNSIILMGANIGNNVIIGAGSIVSGNVPDNVVIAGNPAKIIRTLDEHYNIRKLKYVKEAKECAKEFYRKYKRKPNVSDLGAFFPMFADRTEEYLKNNHINYKLGGDNPEDILKCFLISDKIYKNFQEFLDDIDFEDGL